MFDSIISLAVYVIFYALSIDMTYKIAKLDHRNTAMAILWSVLFSFWACAVYFYVYLGDTRRGDSEQKEIPKEAFPINKLNN